MPNKLTNISSFRSLRYLSVLLVILAASSAGIRAQTINAPRLELDDAVDKALANNPQTKVSESRLKIADLKINEAKAGRKPLVQFTQSIINSNNPVFVFGSLLEQGRFGTSNFAIDALNDPSALTNFRSLISAQMPLLTSGRPKLAPIWHRRRGTRQNCSRRP
ncbi:MAG: TolC family protein [Acidobacteria bacterium]|nr:TolC family protein [Acidobacteriota bacterium]